MNPIVISKEEWARIVKWTDENKEDPEAIRRREYVRFLNETSSKMTKSWPNSVENVNRRNEEIRRARIEAAENANTDFYKKYVKHKKMERKCMMYSARDMIFKNKDAPKLLLSAVVESVVLAERNAQIKFEEQYGKAVVAREKKLDDERILRQAKEWNELMETRKKRRFEVNKQNQKDILDQAYEVSERKRNEYEEELRMQRQDIINSNKEIELIKKFEADFNEAERQRIWKDNEQSLKEKAQRQHEQAARDSMDDQLIEVLIRSRDRTEKKRKETEKGLRDEKLRILDAISKRLATGTSERDDKELVNLNKAIAQKNAEIEARHKAQCDKKEQFRRERREAREQFLRDEAQRLHEEHTMRQWGLMNRFKNDEIYKAFVENEKREKHRKTMEYRDEINRLRKERADNDAREIAERRYFYGELAEKRLRHADNQLLTHAAALLEEAERNGRPTMPIRKAIDRYCKMYRLYPMPELPASLQEHNVQYAPRDGSAPDPGYAEPEPPTPPPPDDAEDIFATKKDGLQDPPQAGPSKKTKKPKPQKPKQEPDYRRQGPANGLQAKPSPKPEDTLPPLQGMCICHLKEQWENRTVVYNPGERKPEDKELFKLQ